MILRADRQGCKQQAGRGQPYGKASGRTLAALVADKEVTVQASKRDRYGRIVGEALTPNRMNFAINPGAAVAHLTEGRVWAYARKYQENAAEKAPMRIAFERRWKSALPPTPRRGGRMSPTTIPGPQ